MGGGYWPQTQSASEMPLERILFSAGILFVISMFLVYRTLRDEKNEKKSEKNDGTFNGCWGCIIFVLSI